MPPLAKFTRGAHSPSCTGCPACSPDAARFISMSTQDQAAILAAEHKRAALRSAGRQHVLRVGVRVPQIPTLAPETAPSPPPSPPSLSMLERAEQHYQRELRSMGSGTGLPGLEDIAHQLARENAVRALSRELSEDGTADGVRLVHCLAAPTIGEHFDRASLEVLRDHDHATFVRLATVAKLEVDEMDEARRAGTGYVPCPETYTISAALASLRAACRKE